MRCCRSRISVRTKDNAFFADGIQDDILTSLAKIKDLRVISRSSVMAFRDAADQNLPHIRQKLGVANILEGSVRKEGDPCRGECAADRYRK